MTIIRLLIIGAGILLIVLGAFTLLVLPGFILGFGWIIGGGILIVAAFIERMRYRSAAAEPRQDAPGPGGGEPLDRPMDPRFRRTDERFVDPTTGVTMRVWIDPESGERRYRAE